MSIRLGNVQRELTGRETRSEELTFLSGLGQEAGPSAGDQLKGFAFLAGAVGLGVFAGLGLMRMFTDD